MSLVSEFSTGKIKVRRSSHSGRVEDGRFVGGKTSLITMDSSSQPLTGKEIRMLPEGRREIQNLNFFTDKALQTNDQINQTQADVVEYLGKCYEIHTVEDWSQMTDLPHYKSVGVLVDPQGPEDE